MRSTVRRALRVLAVATALAATAPLAATSAYAEDPVTTGVQLGEDVVALGVDTTLDLAKGCIPVVTTWTAVPFTWTANIPPGSASTYYQEVGGGVAHLSCSAPVKIVARVMDESVPPVFDTFTSKPSPTYVTSKNPSDTATVNVPYYGPDAPVLRPVGNITVHVEVFRKLSTGRYSQVYNGCMDWKYVFQPAAEIFQSDPRTEGACAYDGAFLAYDTVDSIEPYATAQSLAADTEEAVRETTIKIQHG